MFLFSHRVWSHRISFSLSLWRPTNWGSAAQIDRFVHMDHTFSRYIAHFIWGAKNRFCTLIPLSTKGNPKTPKLWSINRPQVSRSLPSWNSRKQSTTIVHIGALRSQNQTTWLMPHSAIAEASKQTNNYNNQKTMLDAEKLGESRLSPSLSNH